MTSFLVLDRRTDRGREIRFNYDQPKEDDDVDGVPMEEDRPPRQRSRSRDRNVFRVLKTVLLRLGQILLRFRMIKFMPKFIKFRVS